VKRSSTARLVVTYALISLIPVVVLGIALGLSYRAEARQRGIAEGRSEAQLVAQTAVEPRLDGRTFSHGLSPDETASMKALVKRAVGHDVLRLRLRDLAGRVVFSDDGSGLKQRPEDEALSAARGEVVARLTRLNTDSNDVGPVGAEVVEVYVPLQAGTPAHRVGVLELYLPYAPISADVSASLHNLYFDLAVGLAILYLALFAISMSVSRRLRHQLRLNTYLAEHDPLTDLENRTAFHRRAEAACAESARTGGSAAIGLIDLDRFKEVNDTLGHHNGDRLLIELARRLARFLRPEDALARLGGDEFGVILRDVPDPAAVLWRLRSVIGHELSMDALPLTVDSSIGYVVAPEQGSDVDELLRLADVALYVAKAQHTGVVRYHPAQNHYDPAKLALIGELRQAIEADQLVLHYQPKVRVRDGRVDSVEALVRWQHPRHGLLAPDLFVPAAEQTDLIERLTGWVLTRALSDLHGLRSAVDSLHVSVNVSARNLSRPGFAQRVDQTLARVGIPAEHLVIELTETGLLTDPPRAVVALSEVSALGVGVSIDDFGIGQTSLGYLATLPVDELKVDRSFVSDLPANRAHEAIVRSIVELGHNLGLRVVAEGVETTDSFTMLQAMGCDGAQGYLFARPMPADRLMVWLTDPSVRSAPLERISR